MAGLANEGDQTKEELLKTVRTGTMGKDDSPLRDKDYELAVARLEEEFGYKVRVPVAQPRAHTEG